MHRRSVEMRLERLIEGRTTSDLETGTVQAGSGVRHLPPSDVAVLAKRILDTQLCLTMVRVDCAYPLHWVLDLINFEGDVSNEELEQIILSRPCVSRQDVFVCSAEALDVGIMGLRMCWRDLRVPGSAITRSYEPLWFVRGSYVHTMVDLEDTLFLRSFRRLRPTICSQSWTLEQMLLIVQDDMLRQEMLEKLRLQRSLAEIHKENEATALEILSLREQLGTERARSRSLSRALSKSVTQSVEMLSVVRKMCCELEDRDRMLANLHHSGKRVEKRTQKLFDVVDAVYRRLGHRLKGVSEHEE